MKVKNCLIHCSMNDLNMNCYLNICSIYPLQENMLNLSKLYKELNFVNNNLNEVVPQLFYSYL